MDTDSMNQSSRLWKHLSSPDFGPLYVLSEGIMKTEDDGRDLLPDLRNCRSIFVASDYSGDHNTADFQILSFLIGDDQSLPEWDMARITVRKDYLQNREMSYKQLNDKIRARALLPFLMAAKAISGLSITVAIHKKVASLFSIKRLNLSELGLEKYSHWDISILEKLFRVANFIGFFIAGLSRSSQHIHWITDEDAIVANEKYMAEAKEVCDIALRFYLEYYKSTLSCETTAFDNSTMQIKDLVAIPDLIAGALSETVTQMYTNKSMPIDKKVVPLPDPIRPKNNEIISWFADQHHSLKRFLCVIPPRSSPWKTQLIDFQRLE